MDQYIIKGGMSLAGEVTVSGAKNAALGILAAAIMTDEEVIIDNLPDVRDINVMLEAIAQTGVYVDRINRNKVKINACNLNSYVVDDEYIRKIRASYYLIGALLGKYHRAEVALPGGCEIGARPIDQHLKGFRALGANIDISSGRVIATSVELKGAHIFLDIVSVGATINIMLAASLIPGKTVIENVAKEPHIVDVANFLNSMGADIKGAGTDVIRINGVSKLHGTEYSIIPDQIEAGTFMCAAAITRGDVMVKNLIPKHMEAISAKLIETGVDVKITEEGIYVNAVDKKLKPTDIKTLPYPGFPTDLQSPFMAYLATVEGVSTVIETVFENRFMHADEFSKLGASIITNGKEAKIDGTYRLKGNSIRATDLRAGAAMILLGLVATGETSVYDIYHIDRGYNDFVGKMKSLGANIERIED